MKKYAAHYAIARFTPFVETGEFANIGVAIFSPAARYFGYRLMLTRHARVTNFFEKLEARVFRAAVRTLRDELDRVSYAFKSLGTDRRLRGLDAEGAFVLWDEVIKPRETMIRFSDSRVVMADDVVAKLNGLYQYYVERNFVTKEYQEQALERGIRGWLREAQVGQRFFPGRIGNDEYNAQFPFVAAVGETPVSVIKPLNLGQAEPSRVIDHGGQWTVRVRALRKRNLLPEATLFAIHGLEDETPRGRAQREVVAELQGEGVQTLPFADKAGVVNFAHAHLPPENQYELGGWAPTTDSRLLLKQRINLDDEDEAGYWAEVFGVNQHRLREAILQVGNDPNDIRHLLQLPAPKKS